MKETSVELKNTVCLISVFLFGNMLITFPKGEGQHQGLFGFLLCSVYAIVFAAVYIYIQKLLLKINCEDISPNCIVAVILLLFCVSSFIIAGRDYIYLVDTVRLPNTPKLFIALVFLIVVLAITFAKSRVLYMLSFVSLVFILIAVSFMFATSFDNMSFEIFKSSLKFDGLSTFKQSLTFFIHSFGQIPIVLYLIGNKEGTFAKKMQLRGVALAAGVFLICLINVLSVLSAELIDRVDFPYSTAASIGAFGKNSGRYDGFTYYIYFICSAIKTSVILRTVKKFMDNYLPKYKTGVLILFLVLGLLFFVSPQIYKIMQSDALNLALLLFEILLPVYLIIRIKIKIKSQE